MKIVQINVTCGVGSTGKICTSISRLLNQKGIENIILYASDVSNYPQGERYTDHTYIKLQALKSKVFGNFGFNSQYATKKLIRRLKEYDPDIVVLHNLHGHNCNLIMLFRYLKEARKKIIWIFHDCWAFTGYCPHYDMACCDKWKKGGCHDCPQKKRFSWFFDRSNALFEKKKELFTGLDMTIITPSKWLAEQVKQSFLNTYEVKVISNGIDLSVFKPTESDFRKCYGIEDKFVILGVAFDWGLRKGLDIFIELSKRLDERFQIVLVGTNKTIDEPLPDNIISIHRTQNQAELAGIYSAANVFVNPTREENFPTTHMEALACGTPVIAFDTGGCGEMLNEACGCVVEKNNIEALLHAIKEVYEKRPYTKEQCVAQAQKYHDSDKFEEHVALYKSV